MKLLSSKNTPSTTETLQLIGLAGVATALLMLIPGLDLLNYPFRLLLTMVHELGHGLAAMLTGGEFIRFVVFADGSGLAYTAGGWRFFVIPAGYLGTALFGATLILLGRNPQWSRVALGVMGTAVLMLSLFYGIPSIFSPQLLWGVLTTSTGLVFGTLFLLLALMARPAIIIFCTHFVAIQAGLTAFSDIFVVIGLAAQWGQVTSNDAQSMANLTYIPAIVWALLWAVMALILISGSIWITWIAPMMTNRSHRTLYPHRS